MQKRKFDELVSYFNKKVSEMEIETKYKMELLGMATALGCAHEKEMSDLSETKRDSSDTISRQAAIEAVRVMQTYKLSEGDDMLLVDQADVMTELMIMPSAEPELATNLQPTCNQLATDTISRKTAIDALEKVADFFPWRVPGKSDTYDRYNEGWNDAIGRAEMEIETLPSAEPRIIHCGDCKYKDDGIDEDGTPFLKCLNGRSYGGTRINDFCSWAERRQDGQNYIKVG